MDIQTIIEVMPVILSLILIEGLLSVDNAMAIAAMARRLPVHQQQLALRLGIIGAYAFRGLSLLCVSYIISNPWLKILGAIYLIYLMCENLTQEEEEKDESGGPKIVTRGLVGTICMIELMDLALSVDNVIAAVALDRRMWVICTGVFIGILALRFLAGHCIRLIQKFPVLEKTAFLLVGFVGCILLTEMTLEHYNIHFHIDSKEKFVGIVCIVAATMWYEKSEVGYRILHPVVLLGMPIIHGVDFLLGLVMKPITAPIHYGIRLIRQLVKKNKQQENEVTNTHQHNNEKN